MGKAVEGVELVRDAENHDDRRGAIVEEVLIFDFGRQISTSDLIVKLETGDSGQRYLDRELW